ncbi:hypothetical protein A4G19_01090 [Pasteurellaceae bacterium Macca]|nr:hypothetical protein [Pasteurellaceae bacterium Macca]
MQKTILTSLILFAVNASAHDVWVDAKINKQNQIEANLGYGHFPILEKIAEDRRHIFQPNPMQLHTPQGVFDLKLRPQGESYQFISEQPLRRGGYVITARYNPTFWSKKEGKWAQKNRNEWQGAEYCEQTQMFGKRILNVKGNRSAEFITQAVGQRLELIPQINPARVKVGEALPIQVLFEGKPLAGAQVDAKFAGFGIADPDDHHNEAAAFTQKTDKNGIVNVVVLKEGYWRVRTAFKQDYPDHKVCQFDHNKASLTFEIGNVKHPHAHTKEEEQGHHHHH